MGRHRVGAPGLVVLPATALSVHAAHDIRSSFTNDMDLCRVIG